MLTAAAIVLGALLLAYLAPPTQSGRALKRRLASLEESHEALDVRFSILAKRYKSLEGHVYGQLRYDDDDDDDDDAGEQLGAQERAIAEQLPSHVPVPLQRVRDRPDDFPEAAFQDLLAKKRSSHA